MEEKDRFILQKSFYKTVSKLTDEQLGRLFRAICRYQLGESVEVEDDIEMAFEFFRDGCQQKSDQRSLS